VSYALIVGTATLENRITELRILAVHRDLALEEAMRLLDGRPEGTVGHIQRLPADLPEVGAVVRLDPKGQLFNPPAAHRGQRQQPGGRS
jgi:hypothetical protein